MRKATRSKKPEPAAKPIPTGWARIVSGLTGNWVCIGPSSIGFGGLPGVDLPADVAHRLCVVLRDIGAASGAEQLASAMVLESGAGAVPCAPKEELDKTWGLAMISSQAKVILRLTEMLGEASAEIAELKAAKA